MEHSEETQALAALYALGSLDGDEKTRFEQHLRDGCTVCEQEVRKLSGVVEELSLSAPPAEPSSGTRERLLASLDREAGSPARSTSLSTLMPQGVLLREPGLLIARPSDMSWEEVVPGIRRKLLFVDEERHYNTALVRVEAGTRYPSHRHADVEELMVLEGDLNVHGVSMRAGDYCRAEPDTVHQETFSESGCLLLLLTSERDQVYA
jgi:anti-sigma factor ChrR (cupin superfamily)